MAYTLADCRTFLQHYNDEDTSDKALAIYDKCANQGSCDLHELCNWDFDRRLAELTFLAPYSTGTISISVDSPTLSGSSTVWTEAMQGGYFRFNGEQQTYRGKTRTGATGFTLQSNYRGASNLAAGTTYELTFPRIALPTNFRCFENPIIESGDWRLEPALDVIDIKQMLRLQREVNTPREYAIEWAVADSAATTVPVPYMWVYPSPSEKEIIEIPYYCTPSEATAVGHDFGFPDQASLHSVLQQIQLGYLFIEKGKGDKHLMNARAMAMQRMGQWRSRTESLQREEISDEPAGSRDRWRRRWADGEPVYE